MTDTLPRDLIARLEPEEQILWSWQTPRREPDGVRFTLATMPVAMCVALLAWPLFFAGENHAAAPILWLFFTTMILFPILGFRHFRQKQLYVLTNRRAIQYTDKTAPSFAWLDFAPDTMLQRGMFGTVEFARPGWNVVNKPVNLRYIASPMRRGPWLFPPHGRQNRIVFYFLPSTDELVAKFRAAMKEAS